MRESLNNNRPRDYKPNRLIGKAKLSGRLLRARITNNKYVYPLDIRQMGKTKHLVKQAMRKQKNIIIVAFNTHKSFIKNYATRYLDSRHPYMPAIFKYNEVDGIVKHLASYPKAKVYIEEFIDKKQLYELFKCVVGLENRVVLSYSPLPNMKKDELTMEIHKMTETNKQIKKTNDELSESINRLSENEQLIKLKNELEEKSHA